MGHSKLEFGKMAKECPKEILAKFAEHGFEADWVKGEYEIFIGNYPSGKATKAQVMERLKKASTERFPNAVPENVTDALYSARIEIRAQLFFSLTDENGDGKIQKGEMKKFLVFINETQCLGYKDDEVNKLNDEIFKELGKTELTMEDVRAVVAARWGA